MGGWSQRPLDLTCCPSSLWLLRVPPNLDSPISSGAGRKYPQGAVSLRSKRRSLSFLSRKLVQRRGSLLVVYNYGCNVTLEFNADCAAHAGENFT